MTKRILILLLFFSITKINVSGQTYPDYPFTGFIINNAFCQNNPNNINIPFSDTIIVDNGTPADNTDDDTLRVTYSVTGDITDLNLHNAGINADTTLFNPDSVNIPTGQACATFTFIATLAGLNKRLDPLEREITVCKSPKSQKLIILSQPVCGETKPYLALDGYELGIQYHFLSADDVDIVTGEMVNPDTLAVQEGEGNTGTWFTPKDDDLGKLYTKLNTYYYAFGYSSQTCFIPMEDTIYQKEIWDSKPIDVSLSPVTNLSLCGRDRLELMVTFEGGYGRSHPGPDGILYKEYVYVVRNLTTGESLPERRAKNYDASPSTTDKFFVDTAGEYIIEELFIDYIPNPDNPSSTGLDDSKADLCYRTNPPTDTITVTKSATYSFDLSFHDYTTLKYPNPEAYHCPGDSARISINGLDHYESFNFSISYIVTVGAAASRKDTLHDSTLLVIPLGEADGTYTIDAVIDNTPAGCPLTPMDPATIRVTNSPTAKIVEDTVQLCPGELPSPNIKIEGKGGPDWKFSYSFKDTSDNNVDTSNFLELPGTTDALFYYILDSAKSCVDEDNIRKGRKNIPVGIISNGNTSTTNKDTIVVVVSPKPTALFPDITDTICHNGTHPSLEIELKGNPPFEFEMSRENTRTKQLTSLGVVDKEALETVHTVMIKDTGTYEYYVNYIEDSRCINPSPDDIFPLPPPHPSNRGVIKLTEAPELDATFILPTQDTTLCGNKNKFTVQLRIPKSYFPKARVDSIHINNSNGSPFAITNFINDTTVSLDTVLNQLGEHILTIDSITDTRGCVGKPSTTLTITADFPIAEFSDPAICQGDSLHILITPGNTATAPFVLIYKEEGIQRTDTLNKNTMQRLGADPFIYILDTLKSTNGCITTLDSITDINLQLEIKSSPQNVNILETPEGFYVCPDSSKTLIVLKDSDTKYKYTWDDNTLLNPNNKRTVITTSDTTYTLITDTLYTISETTLRCADTNSISFELYPKPEIDDNAIFVYKEDLLDTTKLDSLEEGVALFTLLEYPDYVTPTLLNSRTGELQYYLDPAIQKTGQDIMTYKIEIENCPTRSDTGQLVFILPNVPEDSLLIPEGISPTSSFGYNDYFVISIETKEGTLQYSEKEVIPGSTLTVYNRWGEKVYTASPYSNNWQGGINTSGRITIGKILPKGTYFYIFELPQKGIIQKRFIEIK